MFSEICNLCNLELYTFAYRYMYVYFSFISFYFHTKAQWCQYWSLALHLFHDELLYLNQYWFIISYILRITFQWNFNQIEKIIECVLENADFVHHDRKNVLN